MIILGIFLIALALAVFLDQRTEIMLGISLVAVIAQAYVFMNLGHMLIGVYVAVAASVLAFAFVGYKLISDRQSVFAKIGTDGCLAFFLYLVFFVFFNRGVEISHGVDAHAWVKTPRMLFYYNDLSAALERLSDPHPHFYKLWIYLVEKSWLHWSDTLLLIAKDAMIVICLLPLFVLLVEGEKESTYWRRLVVFVLILLIPYVGYPVEEYSNCGVDVLLGVMIGMGLLTWRTGILTGNKIYHVHAICMMLAASCVKRIAIVTVAICLIWISFKAILDDSKYLGGIYAIAIIVPYLILNANKYVLIIPLAYVAGTILGFATRRLGGKKSAVIYGGLCLILSVGTCVYLVRFRPRYWGWLPEFFHEIFLGEHYPVSGFLHVGAASFALICIFAYMLFTKTNVDTDKTQRGFVYGLLFFFAVYLLLLLVVSLTGTIKTNIGIGQYMYTSLDRYMSTGVTVLVIGLLFVFLKGQEKDLSIPVLLLVLLFVKGDSLCDYIFIRQDRMQFAEFEDKGITLDEDTTIAYIDMGYPNWNYAFGFQMIPAKVEVISDLEYRHDPNERYIYMEPEELSEQLKGCDYVFIMNITDEFADYYGELFARGEDIMSNRAIYTFQSDGKLALVDG